MLFTSCTKLNINVANNYSPKDGGSIFVFYNNYINRYFHAILTPMSSFTEEHFIYCVKYEGGNLSETCNLSLASLSKASSGSWHYFVFIFFPPEMDLASFF